MQERMERNTLYARPCNALHTPHSTFESAYLVLAYLVLTRLPLPIPASPHPLFTPGSSRLLVVPRGIFDFS